VTKTTLIYVKLFPDFACQKLSKSANVSQSSQYSKSKSGTVFLRHAVYQQTLYYLLYLTDIALQFIH